jgi:toxin YoeB
MLKLTWTEAALDDLAWWVDKNPKIVRRIIKLCLNTCKNPRSGIGKPEPLGFDLQGYWSRRITQEHRLVYAFDDTGVTVIQCRFHYEKS